MGSRNAPLFFEEDKMARLKCFFIALMRLFKTGKFFLHDYEGNYEAEDVIIVYDGETIRETDSYLHGLNEITAHALRISMKCKHCGHEEIGYIGVDGGRVN